MATVEKAIQRLDDDKKAASAKLLTATDPAKALALHEEVEKLAAELVQNEDRWLELNELLNGE